MDTILKLVQPFPVCPDTSKNGDLGENTNRLNKEMVEDRTQTPTYHVRYEEFIMILVKYCQSLNARINELENK